MSPEEVIEYITTHINDLLEPYFTRDADGVPVERYGYLRRTDSWPDKNDDSIMWSFAFERPPEFKSTANPSIIYDVGTGLFFLPGIDPTPDPDRALETIFSYIKEIPKRTLENN